MQKTNPAAQKGPQIDIKKTTPFVCNSLIDHENDEAVYCKSEVFMPAMKFRKVSKVLTGTPEDQVIPVQVWMCCACGTIPEEFDLDI
jgi:hypothetical protein